MNELRGSDASSTEQPLTDDETSGTVDTHETPQQRLLSIPLTPLKNPTRQQQSSLDNKSNIPSQPARYAKPRRIPKSTTISTWWQEIGACLLVVLSFVAIVVVMRVVEDKPLPTLPFSISINALIAVFVAIAQASIVFIIAEGISQSKWTWFLRPRNLHDFLTYDNASRGPWGALKLLWVLRGRPLIASLGAFVTITAIILDPVSQQLVQLYDCFVDIPGIVATIPRTNLYDLADRLQQTITENPSSVGLIGSAAIGQFSSSPPQPPFDCRTGNCTFPDQYSSVGYCSRCQNISSYLSVANTPYAAVANNCAIKVDLGPLPQYNTPGDASYYSLSNSTWNFTMFGNMGNTSIAANVSNFISKFDQATASVVMLWIDNALKLGIGTNCSMMPRARASQCILYPCIHTFEASINDSRLHETTLARDIVFGPPENVLNHFGIAADLKCVSDQAKETLLQLGYQFNSSTRWIEYNVTCRSSTPVSPKSCAYAGGTVIPTPAGIANGLYVQNRYGWQLSNKSLEIVPRQCIYESTLQTALNLEEGFESYWPGEVHTGANTVGLTGSPIALSLYSSGYSATGEDALGNISALWQNISDAMTTYVRLNGNPNFSEPTRGQTTHYAVCVGVRWGFLAYIAAVTGLLLIFFVAMLLQTRRDLSKEASRVAGDTAGKYSSISDDKSTFHNFKSNALAVLFHGLDEQSQKALGNLGGTNRVQELEEESRENKFVLVSTGQGWKLSRVNEYPRS